MIICPENNTKIAKDKEIFAVLTAKSYFCNKRITINNIT